MNRRPASLCRWGGDMVQKTGKVQLRCDAVAGPVSCGSSVSKGGRTDRGEDSAWDFTLSCLGVSEGLKPGKH